MDDIDDMDRVDGVDLVDLVDGEGWVTGRGGGSEHGVAFRRWVGVLAPEPRRDDAHERASRATKSLPTSHPVHIVMPDEGRGPFR